MTTVELLLNEPDARTPVATVHFYGDLTPTQAEALMLRLRHFAAGLCDERHGGFVLDGAGVAMPEVKR